MGCGVPRTGLAALLLVVGSAAGTAVFADAQHLGQFSNPPMQMTTCAMAEMMKNHPEMFFQLGTTEKTFSVSGAPTKLAQLDWKLSATESGSGNTTVELKGSGASAAELDEVWRSVESCGHAEP